MLVPVISYVKSNKQPFPDQTPDLSYFQENTEHKVICSEEPSMSDNVTALSSDCSKMTSSKIVK